MRRNRRDVCKAGVAAAGTCRTRALAWSAMALMASAQTASARAADQAPAAASMLVTAAGVANEQAGAVSDAGKPPFDASLYVKDDGTDHYYAGVPDVAMQLSNPVAALISVPLQFNFDGEVGPANDGSRISLNVQPVIPISLNNDWNLISRTIVPVVWQKDVFPGAGSQFGISDTVQSFFLSPARPSGIVWGVGPVVLLPTGTDDLLSTRKWGAGPSALLLKQSGPWTVAVLANQIWSFAGNSSRSNVSQMLVNPFVTYTTPTAFTVAVAADVIRDWEGKRWTMPVIVNGSQMTRVGGQLVQIGGGLRYYVVSNPVSPRGFAARFTVTLLFPR
ncbi:hypothetical protein [Polymorphobacter fuscus]|nr:hypothetical protein [Polymorphobacter fuscus]NJC09367.1 hypothetical protein [Polymorphobacter fuscus]